MNSLSGRAIFAESGHFTAMHNALFDWVQPRLSLSAWSVLCVIVRRTRGWGKKYDAISYEQIKAATGIKSTATIFKALNELLSEFPFGKPILRRQKSSERAASCREATRYALNPRFEVESRGGDEELSESRGRMPEARKESQPANSCPRTPSPFDFPAPNPSVPISSTPNSSPLLESGLWQLDSSQASGALVSEGPEGVWALENEGPTGVRASENEDTKESVLSYKVENSKCERTRACAHFNTAFESANEVPLLASVCAATLRDPAIVSAKMRGQLVMCARRLERAGYSPEHIELAAARWPYPTAPYPSQLLDNIQSLLSAHPTTSRAKPSNPVAPAGTTERATAPAKSSSATPDARRTTTSTSLGSDGLRPRFECAAARKSRKWADWLADIGDA